jgi:hypothetical protein
MPPRIIHICLASEACQPAGMPIYRLPLYHAPADIFGRNGGLFRL